MSLKHQPRASDGKQRNLEDIISQYSSSSSNTSRSLHLDLPSRSPTESTASVPSRRSLSLAFAAAAMPAHHYRRNSTHSGLLRRDQLFGRLSSPTLSSTPPIATSMCRIEKRRSLGFSTPTLQGRSNFSSPLDDKGLEQDLLRDLRLTYSVNDLLARRSHTTTPQSLGSISCGSAASARGELSSSAPDFWVEAGTPEQHVSNNNEYPKQAISEPSGASLSSRREPMSRKVSPAEQALQDTLVKTRSSSAARSHIHRQSWMTRVFNGGDLTVMAIRTSSSVKSDNDLDDLSSALPYDMEASDYARGRTPKDTNNTMKTAKIYRRKDVPQHEPTSFHRGHQDAVSFNPHEYVLEDDMSSPTLSIIGSSSSGMAPATSDSTKPTIVKQHGTDTASVGMRSLEGPNSPKTGNLSSASSSNSSISVLLPSFGPVKIAEASTKAKPKLLIATPKMVYEEAPSPTSIAVPMTTYGQSMSPQKQRGLNFAYAVMVGFGSATFAAMRLALLHLGEAIGAVDLVKEVFIALLVGMILCLFVQAVHVWRQHRTS